MRIGWSAVRGYDRNGFAIQIDCLLLNIPFSGMLVVGLASICLPFRALKSIRKLNERRNR